MKLKSVSQRHRAYKAISEVVEPGFKLYSTLLMVVVFLVFLGALSSTRFCILFNRQIDLQVFFIVLQTYVILMITELYSFEYGRQTLWLSLLTGSLITGFSAISYFAQDSLVMPTDVAWFYIDNLDLLWQSEPLKNVVFFIIMILTSQIFALAKHYFVGRLLAIRFFLAMCFFQIGYAVFDIIQGLLQHYRFSIVAIASLNIFFIRLLVSCLGVLVFVGLTRVVMRYEQVIISDHRQKYKIFRFIVNTEKMNISKME